jgi:hypothetical protein
MVVVAAVVARAIMDAEVADEDAKDAAARIMTTIIS